jgi:hypothetical protein
MSQLDQPFQGLSPFSSRAKDIWDYSHEQAGRFAAIHEAIEAKLAEPEEPHRPPQDIPFIARIFGSTLISPFRYRYEWRHVQLVGTTFQTHPDNPMLGTDAYNMAEHGNDATIVLYNQPVVGNVYNIVQVAAIPIGTPVLMVKFLDTAGNATYWFEATNAISIVCPPP